ncbi:MAG: enoyl-CoA hydratase/isomerase family protein [Alphaproteobacteria bacterium]
MTDESDVLLERRGRVGLVTLNKPRALNALSLSMIGTMEPVLREWARNDAVGLVVIQGAGDRAFCAGGDIRDLYEQPRDGDFGPRYYAAEYLLNVLVHHYPKPWVSLMDGVTMGGGVGVSVHGSHRVVTERTVFAMPETGIGLFPDIGAAWFLPRLAGETGMFMGLTGYRLRAADCVWTGIGDVHVPAGKLPALIDALAGLSAVSNAAIDALLAGFAEDPGPAPLAAMRSAIDRCFSGRSIEEVLGRLGAEGSEWADSQAKILATKSPTSLKITFRQLREGRCLSAFAEAMRMEYRMACGCWRGHDFFEGIRAVVIDKDNAPQWRPAELAGVRAADIEGYFAPVDGEPDFAAVAAWAGGPGRGR